MGQILAKYLSGALGFAEAGDAAFDPRSAATTMEDFLCRGIATNPFYQFKTLGTGTSTALQSTTEHCGALTIATAASSPTANDSAVVCMNGSVFTVSGARNHYFEARVLGTALNATAGNFVVGLSSGAIVTTATTAFATSGIITGPADSIFIGRDQGTDSLTGASANKTLQLCVRGSAGSMTETVLVLPATISNTAYYNIGFMVQGTQVQAYINGKKTGATASYVSTGTNAPMGWFCSCASTSTTTTSMTVDYVAVTATR